MICKGKILSILLVAVSGIAIYSNTFDASFHYDDFREIVNNPDIHWDKLSFENLRELFANGYAGLLGRLSFALNYYFNGLDVRGYHYVNLSLLVLTAAGFFLFVKSIFGVLQFKEGMDKRGFRIALIASLLWLASPLHTQAVTYIAQRATLLAAMSYIYAMFFYAKGRTGSGKKSILYYLLAAISMLFAFMSKGNSFTLPFYLLLLEIIVFRGGDINILFEKKIIIPLFIYTGALIYIYYPQLAAKPGSWFMYLVETRLLTGMRAIIFYILQLFIPVPSRLSLEHDFQVSRSLFEPYSTFIAVIAVCGFLLYALLSCRRRPLFSFFTFWFIGNIAVETFNPSLTLISEQRLYLPSMGFFAIAAMNLDNLIERLGKIKTALAVFLVSLIVIMFSVNTYRRNAVWIEGYSLWADVVKKSPYLPAGYISLGDEFLNDEDYANAVTCYLQAKALSPRSPAVRYGLGVAYFNLKKYDEAVKEFSYLGDMGYLDAGNGPPISYYFSRIAKNYYGHGRADEALNVLDKALLYDPINPEIKELKEKMEKKTLTGEEIMEK